MDKKCKKNNNEDKINYYSFLFINLLIFFGTGR